MTTSTKTKIKKTVKGALIAGSGVALTYFLQGIGSFNFGAYSPMVAGIISLIVNAIRVSMKTEDQI